jgi:hypothetical protein
MRTPFRVSLVAACGVFFAALLAALFHHNSINGRTLTPFEQIPEALVLAVMASALALIGTWLGTRRGGIQHLTYRTGLAVAFLYVVITFLANASLSTAPRTVTFPSHEANIQGLEVLSIGTLWGTFAPYVISLLVSRIRFFRTSNGA